MHITGSANGDVRLVNSGAQNAGRVEVFYSGSWRTVCDDSWDVTDASVVCHQLGYKGARQATSSAHHGQGTGSILLDDLICRGREANLLQCIHSGVGSHNCAHSEDAGAICELRTVLP